MVAVAWEWVASVSSGMVGVAGIIFGWSAGRRSQQQTEVLAEQGNRHAHAMAELGNQHARQLEQLRHDQAERERWRLRLEESYLEIATTVIRLSELMRELLDTARRGQPLSPPESREALVRARALLSLFAAGEVRDRFSTWEDQFHKLTYAVGRLASAGEEHDIGQPAQAPGNPRSAWNLWRRQAQDSRLREVDARDRLLSVVSEQMSPAGAAERGA
jgi:hypothetical protein